VGSELVFRKALERLPEKWDVFLVDCPPAIGLLSISALAACGEVLIPCEAHTMALSGLAGLVQTLERVRERLNPKLTISGIVACRVDARTRLSEEVVSTLRERFGKDVFRAVVRENVRLAEAPSFAKSIFDYDPKSTGAEDYAAVAKELLARVGIKRPQRAKRSRLR
jgi:chromosome partitioning protein